MAELNCSACEDIRQTSPEFIVNGLTDDICTSLANDTGLNPSDNHNDCTDLHNLNDCLVGNEETEVDSYDVCDWKTFMKQFIPNLWTVLKAIICAVCGIWTNIHNLWDEIARIWSRIGEVIIHLNAVSYVGILKLYTTTTVDGDGSTEQRPAFNASIRQGNIAASVLSVSDGYRAITVSNTTSVPLLVDCLFNCSIRGKQHFMSCYIDVTRDGKQVGQTPFITPRTYDQQVSAEPFILQPGQSATMSYLFRIGAANSWFISEFGYGGSDDPVNPTCRLEVNTADPRNQESYFLVKVTSIVQQM